MEPWNRSRVSRAVHTQARCCREAISPWTWDFVQRHVSAIRVRGAPNMSYTQGSPNFLPLNPLPILNLGSEGKKHLQQATYQTTYFCWSNKFLLSLPTSVGLINMTTYFFSPSQRLSSLRLHARDLPVHMRRRPSPSPTPSIGPVSPTPPQGSLDAAAGPAPPHVEVR